jgi:MoaA/NifB/PqqE/SkfB family radical SAM enzyme
MDKLKFRKYTCTDKYGNRQKIEYDEAPLYVVMTRKCNAKCEFCEFSNTAEEVFNIEAFEETLIKLRKQCNISTIHFTGGEPTLELDKIKEILKIVKRTDRLIATSINTNGIRLKELDNIRELDNIVLSRHAIEDNENYEIFGTNSVASTEDIRRFKDKRKLHLSCNIIKGHIDSKEKIQQYLEYASTLDVNDIGLVGLMKVNDFCNKHFVDLQSLEIKDITNICHNRYFRNISDETGELCCMCNNYLYRASNMKLVSVYYRCAIKHTDVVTNLVYENGKLRQGFNGGIVEL